MRLNSAGQIESLRRHAGIKPVTANEWVRFWGLILASTQDHQRGEELWSGAGKGLRDAPNFDQYMPLWRFAQIRRLVKHSN